MDSLAEEFDCAFSVTSKAEADDLHPRLGEYKKRTVKCDQEERRIRLLQSQKERRNKALFNQRCATSELLRQIEESLEDDEKDSWIQRSHKNQQYKNILMLSEWLVDIPSDFESNWCFKIVPTGKRTLVVTNNGSTWGYNRRGYSRMKRFPSLLPKGWNKGRFGTGVSPMLDCIWHEPSKTFYIIDILSWGLDLTDFPAYFRFYWLENKLKEYAISTDSRYNKYKFILVPHYPISELELRMSVHPVYENNSPFIDGVMFFHNEGLYSHCKTPLVTWLKPYMIPEVLNINVAPAYVEEKSLDESLNKMDADVSTLHNDSAMDDSATNESDHPS